jgi:predicted metal-binding membrane protein
VADASIAHLQSRSRATIITALIASSVVAWIVVAQQSRSMSGSSGMHGMSATPSMGHMSNNVVTSDLLMGMQGWVFLGIWVVMMIAMMFPAALPMILMFARVQAGRRNQGRPYVPTAIFVTSYLAVWAAVGAVAYFAARWLATLADDHGLTQNVLARIGGAVLVAAGLYQLTPLKTKCLTRCRTPLDFVLGSWRDGVSGAIRMGVEHALWCVGCCWLLFVVLFPLGIMNVAIMLAITALIFVEKTTRYGYSAARLSGVATIVAGAAVAAFPVLLPATLGPN